MDSRLMTIDGSINSVQDKYQKKFNEYKEQVNFKLLLTIIIDQYD